MNKREYAQANRTSRESRDELAQSMPCKEEEVKARTKDEIQPQKLYKSLNSAVFFLVR